MLSSPACLPAPRPIAVSSPTPRPPAPPMRKPGPRRRWRRRIALTLLGLLLLLGAVSGTGYVYLTWMHDRDLQAAVAEIEAVDPRWRFQELLDDRPPIADDQNPALVVAKVDLLLRPGFDIGEKNWRLFDDQSSVHQLNGAQIVALRTALDKHAEALKLARTLKDFPGEGRFAIKRSKDFISTTLEPLQRCRGVMAMLQYDAMLRAEDEDIAGAMESCRGAGGRAFHRR